MHGERPVGRRDLVLGREASRARREQRGDPEADRGDGTEAGVVLAYHARARKLSGAELAREQEAARRAYVKSRSDGNRMRYALVLAVPGATAADETRALEAVEPLTRNAASPLHGLALLGRWSLTFYMLHQPVLIAALMLFMAWR